MISGDALGFLYYCSFFLECICCFSFLFLELWFLNALDLVLFFIASSAIKNKRGIAMRKKNQRFRSGTLAKSSLLALL
jgi:hypothetical protein